MWKVSDIDGSEVFDSTGEKIGILVDVLPSGSNDIWVVKAGEREYLIPALRDIVREVDVEAKRIVVAIPPGLREIYESQ